MSRFQEYCRNGHLMAETREPTSSGTTRCKVCREDKQKAARQESPERFQSRVFESRLKKFDLTPNDYEMILEFQEYSCAICKRHSNEFKTRLSVDHCHITNKVRGLLCLQCNTAIGSLKDSLKNLKSAIKYLELYDQSSDSSSPGELGGTSTAEVGVCADGWTLICNWHQQQEDPPTPTTIQSAQPQGDLPTC